MASASSQRLAAAALFACLLLVAASDAPEQDFCVLDSSSCNGGCKDPEQVDASDFTSTLLREPANTNNKLGVKTNLVDVSRFPGLNAQGLSLSRITFGAYGVNPPHSHPRAAEIIICLSGRLLVGFVSTSNRQYAQVLYPGDMFVFPQGLVHFQRNMEVGETVAISALGHHNPGRTDAARAMFQASPEIMDEVLMKTLQAGPALIEKLRNSVSTT